MGSHHNCRDRPVRRYPVCGASLGVEVRAINVRDIAEIERGVEAFARIANGGMIVTASALAILHRDLIVALAARYKLPTVYFQKVFVAEGGLISYGTDFLTTLIAAEKTGREACALEIDPTYADVIVQRWQSYTGRPALLAATGATFEELTEQRKPKAPSPVLADPGAR